MRSPSRPDLDAPSDCLPLWLCVCVSAKKRDIDPGDEHTSTDACAQVCIRKQMCTYAFTCIHIHTSTLRSACAQTFTLADSHEWVECQADSQTDICISAHTHATGRDLAVDAVSREHVSQ